MRWVPLVLTACVAPEPFVCQVDADCLAGELAGTCELGAPKVCSFPDPTCPSARRFAALGGEVSGQCVATGSALTYHVRTDGGSLEECDGTVDAPLSADHLCAWSHPSLAMPRLTPGDRLIIGAGEYRVGVALGPPPSGTDPDHATQILGADCADRPRLVGIGGSAAVVELGDASFVELGCLEITDGATCGRGGFGALACPSGGDWADAGVRAAGGTSVVLHDLDVHGMAADGLQLVGMRTLAITDTRAAQNGGAGFSAWGDGTIASENVTVSRFVADTNGCVEALPAALKPLLCNQQPLAPGRTLGYGLIAVVGETPFTVSDSRLVHNTLHGIDLQTRTGAGAVTIERSEIRSNSGYGVHAGGAVTLANDVIAGDCGAFEGRTFRGNVMACRGDVAIQLASPAARLEHNTVYGEGRCLLGLTGTGTATARNNLFVGGQSLITGTQVCFDRADAGALLDHDYGVIWQTQGTLCPRGPNDLCADPLVTDLRPDTFDAHLGPGSPARDTGLAGEASVDRDGTPRPLGGGVDRGAYEQ